MKSPGVGGMASGPLAGRESRQANAPYGRQLGYLMPSHKFQVGETVTLRPVLSRNVPGGAYRVTKQLPVLPENHIRA